MLKISSLYLPKLMSRLICMRDNELQQHFCIIIRRGSGVFHCLRDVLLVGKRTFLWNLWKRWGFYGRRSLPSLHPKTCFLCTSAWRDCKSHLKLMCFDFLFRWWTLERFSLMDRSNEDVIEIISVVWQSKLFDVPYSVYNILSWHARLRLVWGYTTKVFTIINFRP